MGHELSWPNQIDDLVYSIGQLTPAVWVLLTLGLALACWTIYFFYVTEAHEAKPWIRRYKEFLELAQEYGLVVDEESRSARGELGGFPFSAGITSVQLNKSKSVKFWAKLHLESCPPSLCLHEEGMLSGTFKNFGGKELSIGDPEFDATFQIRGESVEEIRGFLEPKVRTAILVGLPRIQKGRVKDQHIETNQLYATPLALKKDVENGLKSFQLMALALKGEGEWAESSADGDTGIIKKKLRKFAFRSLCLWLPLLGVLTWAASEAQGTNWMYPLPPLLVVLLTLGLFTGNDICRVLLQGVYAFASLVIFLMTSLALIEFGELTPWQLFRLREDTAIGFFMFCGVFGLIFWTSRNYLKTLDRVRVVVVDHREEMKGL